MKIYQIRKCGRGDENKMRESRRRHLFMDIIILLVVQEVGQQSRTVNNFTTWRTECGIWCLEFYSNLKSLWFQWKIWPRKYRILGLVILVKYMKIILGKYMSVKKPCDSVFHGRSFWNMNPSSWMPPYY